MPPAQTNWTCFNCERDIFLAVDRCPYCHKARGEAPGKGASKPGRVDTALNDSATGNGRPQTLWAGLKRALLSLAGRGLGTTKEN